MSIFEKVYGLTLPRASSNQQIYKYVRKVMCIKLTFQQKPYSFNSNQFKILAKEELAEPRKFIEGVYN